MNGKTRTKISSASAALWLAPLLPGDDVAYWSNIRFAKTSAEPWFWYIVRTMSKTLSVAMATMTKTAVSVGRIAGTVTRRNDCQAFAPSIFAASVSSAGTPLIAADRMTVAKPAWIQIITTMIRKVFEGVLIGKFSGPRPTSESNWLTRPSWRWWPGLPSGWAYIRLQMTPAPTPEMPVGKKTSAFQNGSPRALSMATA